MPDAQYEPSRVPAVSVVVATRNRAAFLVEALGSIGAQTFSDYEIIVVDDGSTDQTQNVVEGFSDRITFIRQNNLGRSCARNAGITAARGRYIAFLDDDDLWRSDKLEKQIAILEADPAVGLVHTFTEVIDASGQVLRVESRLRAEYHSAALEAGYGYEGIADLCIMFLSSVVIRRECFDRVGIFDSEIPALEDWDLYLRIARVYSIVTISEPLTLYRVHASNTTAEEHLTGRILTARKHLRLLAERDDPSQLGAEFHLHVQLASAHYMAGDWLACRVSISDAFRLRPAAVLRSRLILHYLMTFIPKVVQQVRELRRAAT